MTWMFNTGRLTPFRFIKNRFLQHPFCDFLLLNNEKFGNNADTKIHFLMAWSPPIHFFAVR